jgi:DNA repair protein RecN (Recombination protein N)
MLKHLYIRHFTIIDEVELVLNPGLTVLTGETGAGKSILIDALEMVLGERAVSGLIKTGEERAEVAAIFDISQNLAAQKWLKAQEMDEGQECLLRRVINRDGRSRSTINNRPCPLQTIRELGDLLIHIHGQNQHQQLLNSDYQRELLDDYAENVQYCSRVANLYQQFREATEQLTTASTQDTSTQKDFIAFQLQELAALALQPNELEALNLEHRRLSHAEQWIGACQQILTILSEDESSVMQGLYTADGLVKNLPEQNKTATELLKQAAIQIEEAVTEIRLLLKTLDPDPERMQWVEQRLADIHHLARKHRVAPEQLINLQQNLQSQYQQLEHGAERIAFLEQKIAALMQEYSLHAQRLTKRRQQAVKQLSVAVSAQIQTLGMPNGRIEIALLPKETGVAHPYGNERVEWLVTTNPGQPLQGLNKVVSGGELSRLALAIQVVVAQHTILPTLIFDEVDVGIGGGTAEMVGKQLQNLGEHAQVLCVTHLPQVAAQGHQHLQVQKQTADEKVTTQIRLLSTEEKIQEIARMLGGIKITAKTLAHAKEMVG